MKTNPAQPVRTGENKPKAWDLSTAGRASALQAGGHRFEPYSGSFLFLRLHGQAVKTSPFHGGNTGSNPVGVIFSTAMR